MNQLQALIIGSIILFIGMIIHIIVFTPPAGIVFVAGLVGFLYYVLRVWFTARIPGDLIIFFFEMLLVTTITYGLLIGAYIFSPGLIMAWQNS